MRIFAAAIVIVLGRFVITGQVKDFKPVTDAALLNPDPADWPNWRRTLDGWGYSPLKQIDTRNVKQLQLAWSWGLKPGLSQPNPLVANGMMYVPSPGGGVQTLDAATGDLLWSSAPRRRVEIRCARR
jgi:alcohol dehydrogenase (cytochrome c)